MQKIKKKFDYKQLKISGDYRYFSDKEQEEEQEEKQEKQDKNTINTNKYIE